MDGKLYALFIDRMRDLLADPDVVGVLSRAPRDPTRQSARIGRATLRPGPPPAAVISIIYSVIIWEPTSWPVWGLWTATPAACSNQPVHYPWVYAARSLSAGLFLFISTRGPNMYMCICMPGRIDGYYKVQFASSFKILCDRSLKLFTDTYTRNTEPVPENLAPGAMARQQRACAAHRTPPSVLRNCADS